MTAPPPPLVKICGLTRRADAELAAAAGADFLGVVLAPGGRRSVTAEGAAVILHGLTPRRVGVFVDPDERSVLIAVAEAGLDVVQLHGDETPDFAARLVDAGLCVWKALRPRSGAEFAGEAARWGGVSSILLDGWSVEARGGTGHAFPWSAVAARLDALPAGVRLVAAGGLRPDNVGEAVSLLRPYAVDVSSGVEVAPGCKDPMAVHSFIRAARAPFPGSRE